MYQSIYESGITFEQLLSFTKGSPIRITDRSAVAHGISIDSRTAKKGDVFIALRGENFDGHRFISTAEQAGCVIAIVEYVPEGVSMPCIVVDNTKDALGYIARDYKRLFRTISVAVTGSVGKTTTKQFIYAVLETKYKTNVTKGNFNNEIGLPLTLFGLDHTHEAQLLEMGMNHKGEIAYLSRLAEPNIAVITNIGSAHLENLGSREGIRDAKMEIVEGMSRGGILILNADEPLLEGVKTDGICKIYVGIANENATYHAKNIRVLDDHMLFDIRLHDGKIMNDVRVNVIGKHNIYNALFACVCGIVLGISEEKIREGLLRFTPADMRQAISEKDGITIIEDCYNASPESMRAGLDVLCHTAKTKGLRPVAVLGDMRELGDASDSAHLGVGAYAAKADLAHLITFGKDAALIAKGAISGGMSEDKITVIEDIENAEIAAQLVKNTIKTGDAVLFKASRAVAIERIIRLL